MTAEVSDVAFRPLYDHVLVKRLTPEKRYGNLIIPDSAQEQAYEGIVMAVGKGICNYRNGSWHPLAVAKGDHVIFGSKHAGNDVKIGDESYVILREDEIAAVLE